MYRYCIKRVTKQYYKACLFKVLSEVSKVATAAETVKAEVKEVADRATAIVEEIAVDKGFAEEKLEAARPALEEAEAALLVSPF